MSTKKNRELRKMYDFGRNYCKRGFTISVGGRRAGRTSARNYLIQSENAGKLSFNMNMNYAEVEKLVFASYLKCNSNCPFLKLLFAE